MNQSAAEHGYGPDGVKNSVTHEELVRRAQLLFVNGSLGEGL